MVGFKNDKFGVTPIFSNIDIDITYCFNTNLFQKTMEPHWSQSIFTEIMDSSLVPIQS